MVQSPSMPQFATLVDLLRHRAQHQPDQLAYQFLEDGKKEAAAYTHAELDQQAQAIAALLQQSEARGERALLLYPQGVEVVAAFCGCLYAGVIAHSGAAARCRSHEASPAPPTGNR
jgi:acyl-CoA synthetase (AMP-forming)/AMP-acid ligase II